ncbi:hypothetical protein DPR02_18190, partial [Burkholderia cepacia]
MFSTAIRERQDGLAGGARECGPAGPDSRRPDAPGLIACRVARESGAAASHNVIQRPRKRKAFDAAAPAAVVAPPRRTRARTAKPGTIAARIRIVRADRHRYVTPASSAAPHEAS